MKVVSVHPADRPGARVGLTLLEVIIASGIMILLFVALTQGMVSTLDVGAMERSEDRLADEAFRIQRTVAEDLAQSGWHFVSDISADYALGTPQDPIADRRMVYYPYVIQQAPSGEAWSDPGGFGRGLPRADVVHANLDSGEDLTHFIRPPGMVQLFDPADPPPAEVFPRHLPGEPVDFTNYFHDDAAPAEEWRLRYDRSYYARSQELVFLKALVGRWAADPIDQERHTMTFAGDTATWQSAPVSGSPDPRDTLDIEPFENWDLGFEGLSGSAYDERRRELAERGLTIPGAWVSDLTSGAAFEVEVRWETKTRQAQLYDPTSDQRIKQSNLREYTYCLVPSPYGYGRLVRAYSVDFSVDMDEDTAGDQLFPDRGQGVEPGHWLTRQGDVGVVVDKVLSENVVRVVFDTYRTVDHTTRNVDATSDVAEQVAPSVNQVRMRLYLARASARDPAVVVRRRVDTVFTMRTKNHPDANAAARAFLGPRGADFQY